MKQGSRIGIGLIGFGNFGRFILPYLEDFGDVSVYDKASTGLDYQPSLEIVASKKLVIFSVPSQSLESALINSRDYIRKDATVIDVCSVKVKPCSLMEKYLPETAEIIGTHPLFGPESAKDGLDGHSMVLCPVRTSRIEEVACFVDNLKLKAIVTSPEEHDRQMAYVQGLPHLIAKAVNKMNVGYMSQRTKAYDLLLKLSEMLKNDSDELYNSIENENPYAKDVRDEFIEKLLEEAKGC